jgi:hypothetical protein
MVNMLVNISIMKDNSLGKGTCESKLNGLLIVNKHRRIRIEIWASTVVTLCLVEYSTEIF